MSEITDPKKLLGRVKLKPRGNQNPPASGRKSFQKGVSGNPGGRPKRKILTDALKDILESPAGTVFQPQTVAEEVALGVVNAAKKGDVRAAQLVGERTEGKPTQPVHNTYDLNNRTTDELQFFDEHGCWPEQMVSARA